MSMILTNSMSKSPVMLKVIGILAILLFGYSSFFNWRELEGFPSDPEHMSLSAASSLVANQHVWVVIDDIKWDCSHVYYYKVNQSTNTDVLFTDKDNTLWGLATFSSEMTCDEVMQEKGIGVLDVANDKKRNDLIARGFDVSKYETGGKLLSLCTYCGKDNSRLGVLLSVVMVILGVSLVVTAHKMQKRVERSRSRLYVSGHKSA
jgi:hypothetical protein